jgi:acyl-CoA reductase-like NAD-dependent aldehyde dehydrogenase
MMKLIPALMSGNNIVFKPSPNTSLGKVLPAGVRNVVQGDAKVGTILPEIML